MSRRPPGLLRRTFTFKAWIVLGSALALLTAVLVILDRSPPL